MDIIQSIENEQIRDDLEPFEIGDYVRVHLSIKEGSRERIQVFEGTVIARQGRAISESFTVRRISYGVGVERIIPVHSPKIQRIEVVRKGRVRRAKLYYLRERVGKAAKVRARLQVKAKKKNQKEQILENTETNKEAVVSADKIETVETVNPEETIEKEESVEKTAE